MTTQEAYTQCRIFHGLQLHQLRVAGIGSMLAQQCLDPESQLHVTRACLFHDMGNIVKSNFDAIPEVFEPEGVEYWKVVKAEVISKYGSDEHEVTDKIAEEIGLSETERGIIRSLSFHALERLAEGSDVPAQIVQYADMRVGPHGVLTARGRFLDALERYRERGSWWTQGSEPERILALIEKLEKRVCTTARMRPEDFTNSTVEPVFDSLLALEVA